MKIDSNVKKIKNLIFKIGTKFTKKSKLGTVKQFPIKIDLEARSFFFQLPKVFENGKKVYYFFANFNFFLF